MIRVSFLTLHRDLSRLRSNGRSDVSMNEPASNPPDRQMPSLIRVRYAETDQMGYVYHGNFFMYFEVARGDMARATGVAYTAYEAYGAAMPLR